MSGAVFPDAEAAVITYLAGQIPNIPVAGRVPNPRPDQFVRVERIGGPRETRVTDGARFAVEAWAQTDIDAAVLLNQARSSLADVEGDLFGADEYGGPARLPDPNSNMSRYTASYAIRIRPIQ